MTLDIPNLFVQTEITLDQDKIIMKKRGRLVDIIIEICPGVYDKYVWYEGKQNIIYVRILKTLYGILFSSIM